MVNDTRGKEESMNKIMSMLLMCLGVLVIAAGPLFAQTADPLDTLTDEVSEVVVNEVESVPEKTPLAADLAEKAKVLLARAQQFLDEGQYKDAIAVAQNILSFDPQNADAQKIFETAKAKLAEFTKEKAGSVTSGLLDTLGTTEE